MEDEENDWIEIVFDADLMNYAHIHNWNMSVLPGLVRPTADLGIASVIGSGAYEDASYGVLRYQGDGVVATYYKDFDEALRALHEALEAKQSENRVHWQQMPLDLRFH